MDRSPENSGKSQLNVPTGQLDNLIWLSLSVSIDSCQFYSLSNSILIFFRVKLMNTVVILGYCCDFKNCSGFSNVKSLSGL